MKVPTREEWDAVWNKIQARIDRIRRDTLTLRPAAEAADFGHGAEADRYLVSGKSESQNVSWRVWLDQTTLVMDLKALSDDADGKQVTVTLPDAIANLGDEDISIEWENALPENLPSLKPLAKGNWVSITLGVLKTPLETSTREKLKEWFDDPQLTFEAGSPQQSPLNIPSDGVGATLEGIGLQMQVGTPEPHRRSERQKGSFPFAAFLTCLFSAMLNRVMGFKFAPIAGYFQVRFVANSIRSPLARAARLTMPVFAGDLAAATISEKLCQSVSSVLSRVMLKNWKSQAERWWDQFSGLAICGS
jgi:hypothetical protein